MPLLCGFSRVESRTQAELGYVLSEVQLMSIVPVCLIEADLRAGVPKRELGNEGMCANFLKSRCFTRALNRFVVPVLDQFATRAC